VLKERAEGKFSYCEGIRIQVFVVLFLFFINCNHIKSYEVFIKKWT